MEIWGRLLKFQCPMGPETTSSSLKSFGEDLGQTEAPRLHDPSMEVSFTRPLYGEISSRGSDLLALSPVSLYIVCLDLWFSHNHNLANPSLYVPSRPLLIWVGGLMGERTALGADEWP